MTDEILDTGLTTLYDNPYAPGANLGRRRCRSNVSRSSFCFAVPHVSAPGSHFPILGESGHGVLAYCGLLI